MSCDIVVKKCNELTFNPSMDNVTSSWTLINSLGISILLFVTGVGLERVVLPFTAPISGPNALVAKFISSVVTSLFLMRFMRIIAFKSSTVGVPIASYSFLAFFALCCCLGDKKFKFSSSVFSICIFG